MKHHSASSLSCHPGLNAIYRLIILKIVSPDIPCLYIQPLISFHAACPLAHLNFLTSANDSTPGNGTRVLSLPTCHRSIIKPHMYWTHSFLSISTPGPLSQHTIVSHPEYSDDNNLLPHFAVFPVIPSTSFSMWQQEQYWDSDLIRPLFGGFPLQKVKLHDDGYKPLCDLAPTGLSPYPPIIASALYSVLQTY